MSIFSFIDLQRILQKIFPIIFYSTITFLVYFQMIKQYGLSALLSGKINGKTWICAMDVKEVAIFKVSN